LRLYDFTLLTVAQVLVEAFLFSFGYGVITVLTCNWLLVGRVDDRVGWNTQRGDDTHMRFWKIENGNCATTTRPLKHPRTARRS